MLNARSQQDIQRIEAKRDYNRERYWNTHTPVERENSVECKDCKGWITFKNWDRHRRTKKHTNAIKELSKTNPGLAMSKSITINPVPKKSL